MWCKNRGDCYAAFSTERNTWGYPAEVGALFTTVSSIRVSRVGVTLTVTVRVSRVSVRDIVK